jgi:hypothetical protein
MSPSPARSVPFAYLQRKWHGWEQLRVHREGIGQSHDVESVEGRGQAQAVACIVAVELRPTELFDVLVEGGGAYGCQGDNHCVVLPQDCPADTIGSCVSNERYYWRGPDTWRSPDAGRPRRDLSQCCL